MVALAELVDFKGGGTPSKSVESYWGGTIPWASVKDFKSSELSKTTDYITEEGLKNSASNLIPADNLIVPTRMALGKVVINTIDVAINQDLRALIVKNEELIDKRYLFRFLESKAKYLEREGKGATVKGITQEVLKELEIPLPALAEQKRIAAILDKADSLRYKNQQAIQLADQFLRAVFLDMFGDPVSNPKGWDIKPLGEMVKNLDGRRIPVKASDRAVTNAKYRYYGASGIIDYVDDYIFDERTLLIGEDGANLLARSTPIAFIVDGKYWVNNHAHVLSENGSLPLEYLMYSINMRSIAAYVTGSAQPKLNQEMLNKIPIQVPNHQLLNKFVKIIESVSSLNKKFSDIPSENLFDSLSQKAFAGEL